MMQHLLNKVIKELIMLLRDKLCLRNLNIYNNSRHN